MSFWPFSTQLSSNSQLQKFLDGVTDVTTVTCKDMLDDPELSQELVSELHNIKGNYSNSNYSSLQFQLDSTNNIQASDAASFNSSTTESNNGNSNKDSRGAKLLEILLQPHILNGFLDHIVHSVEFFYQLSIKEEAELEKLISDTGSLNEGSDQESDKNEDMESESETDEEKTRRLIQASSDILSIDLWVILNRIIETPVIMGKLWLILLLQHLEESSPSVSYLVHILDQLMDTNSIELLNFLRRQPDLVDTFISKIEIPVLMDFFLRIIQTDKPESPTGILETLHHQELIPKLIEVLKPHPSQFEESYAKIPNHDLFFKQTAATDFLKALVTISSNTALAVVLETNIGPNQLTRELVSPKIINIMIHEIMLYKVPTNTSDQTNKHGINNCVGIIIELIRKNNSDYDLSCGSYSSLLNNDGNGAGEVNSYVMYQWLKDFDQNPPGPRDPIYLGDMLHLFSENLDKFTELMNIAPLPPKHVDQTKILGFTKFKISELIAELLHCSNMILLNSKRIRKVMHVRDHARVNQASRIQKALADSLDADSDSSLHDVTSGLDDISLDDIHFEDQTKSKNKEHEIKDLLDLLENEEVSDDDEPSISPESPFVCPERDKSIRNDPCVGDFFKTKLFDLNILNNIVAKFTEYPWHNFFHNVVFDLIQQIFNGKLNSYNSFLIVDLFDEKKCNLTNFIVNSYKVNEEPRPGYMGHLILISEEVVKFTSLYKPDLISPIIVDSISSEKWEWFVNEVLLKTREVYNVVLGAEQDEDNDKDHFESSTVGYLDLDSYDHQESKPSIILGDSSNHEEFVNDNADMEESEVPDIQDMSPKRMVSESVLDEDGDDFQDHDFLDNLSGSSSSEEDDDDDSNELRRVPKHND